MTASNPWHLILSSAIGVLCAACSAAGESATVATESQPTEAPSLVATTTLAPTSGPAVLFDDFTYTDQQSMINHGWIIRTESGWPGVPNAVWAKNSVSFVDDADQSGNRLLRMTSSTDGTTVRQTQFCHQRKYMAPEIGKVLGGAASEGDPLAGAYHLARAYEVADWERVEAIAKQFRMPIDQLGDLYCASVAWAQEVLEPVTSPQPA